MIAINHQIQIPSAELDFQYVRSSGPGGQNVNKVATKAVLRWDVSKSPSIPESVRRRFLERYAKRVNVDGELVLSSDRHRSQSQNIEDCIEKLKGLLLEVATPPKPRRPTRPSAGVKRRRLKDKRLRSETKKRRRPVSSNDD